ncbi:MAG: hypothetical protein AAGG46_07435 [Planctomycetota bacterium]
MWLIGVDEAGYGPNLGPLVIGATAWRVNAGSRTSDPPIDLYTALATAVSDAPARDPDGDRLAIADSKRLYKPGSGWRLLELGVLGALAAGDRPVGDSDELLTALQAEAGDGEPSAWRRGEPIALPVDAGPEEVPAASARFADACGSAGVAPPRLRARLVQPDEFNTLVEQHGTKGAALSHVTIGLLRSLVDSLVDSLANVLPVRVVLDKHGGRNRYASLLQHHFPEQWIETLTESRAESRYRTRLPSGVPIELTFRTGGEAFLPTALASMTAKLVREIEMRRFNTFWRRHLPHLKPTAGYPFDAKRFKAEIAAKQSELGIDDHTLWRCR